MAKVALYKARAATRGSPGRHVWLLRWIGTDTKRYCERIGVATARDRTDKLPLLTKREADRIQRQKQGAFDHRVRPVNRPKRVTLEQFFQQDREAIQADVRPRTLKEYDLATGHAKAALGGDTPLERVGRELRSDE